MRVGSGAHRDLFCESFIRSHRCFEPDALPWPDLAGEALDRIRAVPFWQEVLHTERRAIDIIEAFVRTVPDSKIRAAIELMGYEERRHERLVEFIIERYGIETRSEPTRPLPRDVERAFIDFGYGECVDAFLGVGLFKMAREAEFLPDAMFNVLDVLMYEETRHILLFTNWMAYREARHGRSVGPLRGATAAWHYGRSIGSKVRVAIRNARGQGDGRRFAATQAGAFLQGFSVQRLVEDCLREHERRLGQFEADLVRPRFMPGLALIVRGLTRWGAMMRPGKAAARARASNPSQGGRHS